MQFEQVLGQEHIKSHLETSSDHGRIPHAQLFVGSSGSGVLPMALAYACKILCINNISREAQIKEQVQKLMHPDLHFVYPVANNQEVKKHAVSELFLDSWREFVTKNPYASLFEWYQHIGIENKQGRIGVDEAQDMVKKLSLKAYQGGYKVMLIWMADKMNTECANKILKLVEEPPANTVLLLLTENEEQLIGTIRSRCQVLHFPLLSEQIIAQGLQDKYHCDPATAATIARRSEGSFNNAIHILKHDSEDLTFEKWFLYWVRTAFKARGNKMAINDLLSWSEEVAASGRETQKKFLHYCLDFMRDALLVNYNAGSLVINQTEDPSFDLNKFAPFIHEGNILEISEQIQDALYHVERNGNAKIIFADLAIALTRLIHKKAV